MSESFTSATIEQTIAKRKNMLITQIEAHLEKFRMVQIPNGALTQASHARQ